MLGEEQGRRTSGRVEQEEESIARRKAALAIRVPARRELEHDVARAFEVRALHMDFRIEVVQLDNHRIGQRRVAEGAETALHGRDRHAEGDLVSKCLERNDFQSENSLRRPRSVSANASWKCFKSPPNPKRRNPGIPK